MLKNVILSLVLILFVIMPVNSQENILAGPKVDGLELPGDQTVNFDEGFINLQAKCKGEVKWLVISAYKIKYVTVPNSNSIIISVPTQGGTVSVFAVGLVDGKLTDFARTNINVSNTNPAPQPGPVTGPIHVTFLVDLNTTTPELAQILNSQTLRTAITTKGNFLRVYDINSPIIVQKKLDQIVKSVGGSAILVIQRNDGLVIEAVKIPKTEAEIMEIINKVK